MHAVLDHSDANIPTGKSHIIRFASNQQFTILFNESGIQKQYVKKQYSIFIFNYTNTEHSIGGWGRKMYFYYLRSNSSSPWPFTTYSFSLITNLIRIDAKINRHLSSARLRIGIASDVRQFRRTVTGGIHSVLFLYHWLLFIPAVLDVYWLNACCQFWSCFFFALLLYQLTFSSHATVYTHQ